MALIAKNSTIFAKVSVAIWLKILKVNIIQRLVEQCNFDADLSISLYTPRENVFNTWYIIDKQMSCIYWSRLADRGTFEAVLVLVARLAWL